MIFSKHDKPLMPCTLATRFSVDFCSAPLAAVINPECVRSSKLFLLYGYITDVPLQQPITDKIFVLKLS